jgi:hypothetical protein
MAGSEDVVGELLALPPEEFTAARNAAVKRLRAEGQRDVAETIKGLPRPPVSLWALNHLAHEQPKLIEAFLDSAEQLREAYRSGGDIRAATSPERDAEAAVVAAAVELARSEGRKLTETVLERLRQTVRAAAADADIGEELRDGRLISEPEAPSIGELLGSMPATSRKPSTKPESRRDRDAERRALREEITAAESDASEKRGEARAAADAARAAEREWQRTQKLAEQARLRSDTAEQQLEELRQQLKAR